MIKKYITLAALLSAGTALANAESFKIETNFTRGSSQGNATLSATTTYYKGNVNITPVANGGSRDILPTVNDNKLTRNNLANYLESRGDAGDNMGVIALKTDLRGSGKWSVTIPYSNILETTLSNHLNGKSLKIDSIELHLGAFQSSGNPGYWITSAGQLELNTRVSFDKNGAAQTHRVTVEGNGNKFVSGSGSSNVGTGPSANPDIIQIREEDAFVFGQGNLPQNLTLTFSGGSNSYRLALGKVVVHASSYTPPVPEPSAFGFLAGLGALALVASRRRRK